MLIPPGYVQVSVLTTNFVGHRCMSSTGYITTDSWTQANADDVSDTLAVPYKAWLSAEATFDGVRILVGSDGDPAVFESNSSAGPGSRHLDLAPPQTMGLIKKSTTLTGRKNRGRLFIHDVPDSQCDDAGNLNSTAVGLLQDIAIVWNSALGVGALISSPVILHSVVGAPTPITSMAAETKVATLRRRFPRS